MPWGAFEAIGVEHDAAGRQKFCELLADVRERVAVTLLEGPAVARIG